MSCSTCHASKDNCQALFVAAIHPCMCKWPISGVSGNPRSLIHVEQWSAAAYLVSIGKCSAHPLLAHVRTCSCDFGMGPSGLFSQLRRAFLLLRQRISVQSRETSRFSTPRANFVFVTLTLMQGKLVMVCVCRPLM